MNVLFLDIDGVLNSKRSTLASMLGYLPYPPMSKQAIPAAIHDIDWVAVGLVATLCKRYNAKIVLSSAWRETFTVEYLAEQFGLPIIDATDTESDTRGNQIQRWLDKHPEVEFYAIVDDNSGMLSLQKDHFVQTDFDEGLTLADFKDLCTVLEGGIPNKHANRNVLLWDEDNC